MTLFSSIKTWARTIKRDVVALWIAAHDRRVPWYAKVVAGAVAAYALSPIDLIPDFIPVIGYLDDLIIVPLDPTNDNHLALTTQNNDVLESHDSGAIWAPFGKVK